MKLLIVGSTRHMTGNTQALEDACRQIGAALASAGHSIIVGSDDVLDVDRHVVLGANSVPGKHKITIYRPTNLNEDPGDSVVPYLTERLALSNLDIGYFPLDGDWTVAHTAAIRDADAILIIGGRSFAQLVSRLAPLLGKPLLAIPLFGGAAQDIWTRIAASYETVLTQGERQRLTILWDQSSAAALISVLERLYQEPTPRTPGPDRPFRILSISGGGIRGIFQATYLAQIERRLRPRRIVECFGLIAGTSTGAIIALGISLGVNLDEIVKLFEVRGIEIFPPSVRKNAQGYMSWLQRGHTYDQKPLRKWLEKIFCSPTGQQLLLRDCTKPVIIASGILDRYGTHTFTTLKRRDNSENTDMDLVAADVALCSSAAPLYFPAVSPRRKGIQKGELEQDSVSYIDGGLWANTPALVSVLRANWHFGIPFEEMRVISIGNGEVPEGKISFEFNNLRRFRMIYPFVDIMYSMQSELADKATAQLVGDPLMKERMLRINVDLRELIALDDVDKAVRQLKPIAGIKAEQTIGQFAKLIQ